MLKVDNIIYHCGDSRFLTWYQSHVLKLFMSIEFSNVEQKTPKEEESRLLEHIVKSDKDSKRKRSGARRCSLLFKILKVHRYFFKTDSAYKRREKFGFFSFLYTFGSYDIWCTLNLNSSYRD